MLTKKNTNHFINFYAVCFVANYFWLYFNGLTFSTFNPIFFTNKLDFTTNLLLLTNIQQLIISSKACRIVLDIIFFTLPFILLYTNYFKIKYRPTVAICNTLFNLLYCTLLAIFTFTTTQQAAAWVLVPIIFCCITEEKFTALFTIFRWIFLAIFLSAGLWKLATGAIFNTEQLSAILLQQHAQSFIDGKENFIIRNLIHNKNLAHIFYIAAFLAEISFAIGFFTSKYDKYLAAFFCLFIVLDYFLMEINYFSWIVFIGFLLIPNKNNKQTVLT